MTDQPTPEDGDRQTVQLLVHGDSDRTALTELLGDRYDIVTGDELVAADCYVIGDRMVPSYRGALRAHKRDADPTFCPVLLIRQEQSRGTIPPPSEQNDDGPPLIDEVVAAPVTRTTLHRRLGNLLARREQSLELSRRYEDVQTRFQRVFNATNDALIVITPTGKEITECNPAACDLVGYTREELLSVSPSAIIAPEYRERLRSILQDIQQAEGGWTGELACLRNDGETRQLEVSAATLDDTDQSPVILSARDVTAQKAYERELELKSRAMDEAPVGITISDPTREDNPIIYVNDGFEEVTGYTEADALGRNCRFLQGEDTRAESVKKLREAIAAAEPVSVELRNYRKDGSQFWNRVSIAPVRDDSGDVRHFIGFQQDVTERKERDQNLQLFKKAVENMAHSAFITDRGGIIEYVNPAFEARTGYSSAEAVGQTPRILKSGKHNEAFYRELWETILDGERWDARLINQRKNGELYHVDQTISPITNAAGEISHFVAIEADVTNRRLREQRLGVLNRVLRHNVRNGMTVIEGHAALLRDELAGTELESHVSAIEARTEELARLSDEAGTVRSLFDDESPAETACDVQELLSTLVEEFSESHPSATLSISGPDGLYARADNRLQVALRELLTNAIAHNDQPEPEVRLTARPAREERAGEWIEIVIADDGPGIPRHEQAPFETGEETPLQHGTGLGLWIVYWTVALFGGEVTFEDTPSGGTSVVVSLPRATGDATPESPEPDAD